MKTTTLNSITVQVMRTVAILNLKRTAHEGTD